MSWSLNTVINQLFRDLEYNHCYRTSDIGALGITKYMDIPIHDDLFEVPLFAFSTFIREIRRTSDAIIVRLDSIGRMSNYVTVDRCMKDVLVERYRDSRLVVLNVKQGDGQLIYYGTQGAVFDKELNPIMMCSYQIRRIYKTVEDSIDTYYEIVKPILRISPKTYLRKGNAIEKFIANKMINACLEYGIYTPYQNHLSEKFLNDNTKIPVKVVIDDFPFTIHETDVPSISTTNKQLIQCAVDHIDELIQ